MQVIYTCRNSQVSGLNYFPGVAASFAFRSSMFFWMTSGTGETSTSTSRYDSASNPPGMALINDVPGGSCGKASMKLTSGVNANATDLYKRIPGEDELFVRYYAKYDAGTHWHHTGVWFGGYNPPTPYANPMAGLRPAGDDRFSVS